MITKAQPIEATEQEDEYPWDDLELFGVASDEYDAAVHPAATMPRDVNLELMLKVISDAERMGAANRAARLPHFTWHTGGITDLAYNVHRITRAQVARGVTSGEDLSTLQDSQAPLGHWAILDPQVFVDDNTWDFVGEITTRGIPTSVHGHMLKKKGREFVFPYAIGNGELARKILPEIQLKHPNVPQQIAFREIKKMPDLILTGLVSVSRQAIERAAPHLKGDLLNEIFRRSGDLQKARLKARLAGTPPHNRPPTPPATPSGGI